MLRNLLLFGAAAAGFAALPALFQHDPQVLAAMLRRVIGEAPRSEAVHPVAAPDRPQPREAEVLLGRKVRIPSDGRGHYSADFRLNGHAVDALVDTGATYVAINRSTARRIGLNLVPADFRYRVDTANGQTAAAAATIETLQIGRIHVEDVQAVVLEDAALSGTLVGMSFLNRLSRFQVEGGSLVLEQ